jgi:hypothetical protein
MPNAMLLGVGLALLLGEPALTWDAPLHCPTRADTAAAIEHYLGRSLAEADPPTDMRVHEAMGGYRLVLRTRAGAHVIEGVDCGRLIQLAASVAAIAIDPLAQGMPVDPPSLVRREPEPLVSAGGEPGLQPQALPATEAEPTEPAIVDPVEPPILPPMPEPEPEPDSSEWQLVEAPIDRPADARRRDRQLRGLLTASAGLGLAVFPNPAPGVEAGVGIDRGALHVELGAGGWFAGRFRSSEADVGGDLQAWQASVRPCGVPRWRRIELRACGSVGAGQVRARGVGVVDPEVVRQPWVWIAGDLGLAVVLHPRAALFLDVGAAANLLRPRFWTESPASEYQMPIVSGRGRFGIEVRFP